MRKILLALPVAALALGGVAHASDTAAVLDAREAYFKSLGKSMKAMMGLAKAFDPAAAKAEAATLEKILATDAAPLFPAGTSSTDLPGQTEAKASIWANMDDFGAKGKAMHDAGAEVIAAANAGNSEAFGAALMKMGGACKACHDLYREEE